MTPAIDILKKQKISFTVHEYIHDAAAESFGEEAASKLGIPAQQVFKTLVVTSPEGKLAVAIVPVSTTLNMKQTAKVLHWKKAVMADKIAVTRSTGYVLGGVSPLGQKKPLPTVIDISAKNFDTVFVSAGKRGLEIELQASELCDLLDACFYEIGN